MLSPILERIKRGWQLPAFFLALWLGGIGLSSTTTWQSVERRGYDLLTVIAPAPGQILPITLVSIDDRSLEMVGSRWPWPRSVHARLIDRIRDMGAKVIVFDVVLALPTVPKEDDALAAAIRRTGSIVMAAESFQQETLYGTLVSRLDPLPLFIESGAEVGLANISLDRDLVVRTFPDYPQAFWRAMLSRIPDLEPVPPLAAGEMLRYLGPSPVFPKVSAGDVLKEDSGLPPDAFADQLVLIGRDTQGALELGTQADMFATPYTAFLGKQTPGVELQASFVENAVRNLIVVPAPPLYRWGLIGLLALITTLSMRWLGVVAVGAVAVALVAGLAGLAYALFVWKNLWLPVFAPALLPIAGFVARYGRTLFEERQHKQEIKRMFSLYVPDEVVATLVDHPEKLVLGGEARQITVIFCDMQGFTSLSEALPPTRLAHVVNMYLDMLSEVIFAHGGTVDKYIGDAIMAFWGAPLDDEDHALHALQSVRAMFDAIPVLNAQLTAEGLPNINVRIGMHSGEAVVGNLGSRKRFSYTAVGDTINLAARLEPMNKEFHTRFMFSDATLERATRTAPLPWPLRALGDVTVRGKTQAVKVYTFTDIPE